MGFVYVLKSDKGILYIGSTTRPLEERIKEHQLQKVGTYTAKFKCFVNVAWWEMDNSRVRAVESHLKKNRYLLYDLIDHKESVRVQNFAGWLKEHGIEIRNRYVY